MKQKILKLIKILNKFTIDDILSMDDFEEKEVSLLEVWLRTAIEADTVEAFLARTGLDRII